MIELLTQFGDLATAERLQRVEAEVHLKHVSGL
jgi:hypothetical protein